MLSGPFTKFTRNAMSWSNTNGRRGRIRVAVVARQAGSANALAPVIRFLRESAGAEVAVFGFQPAYDCFLRLGMSPQLVEPSDDVLGPFLPERPDGLLTGTSLNAGEDGRIWTRAQQLGVPSLALLDHWCHYWERFTAPGQGRFNRLPDKIAVMDQAAFMAMVKAGCPRERLAVTGHPALDELTEREWPLDRTALAEVGLPDGNRTILFVSEPQSKDYGMGPDSPNYLGYTEELVLDALLAEVESLTGTGNLPTSLIIRPHPTETGEVLEGVLERHRRVPAKIIRGGSPRPLVSTADAVVGMTSILLMEAALMGRPVASFRPNNRVSCDLVDLHPGLITSLANRRDLNGWLADNLPGSKPFKRPIGLAGFQRHAARRVVELLGESMIDRRGLNSG